MHNELGQFSQGYESAKEKNAIVFIHKEKVPKSKRTTCAQIFCGHKLCATELHRVCLTASGKLISYSGVTSTPIVAITTIKAH